MKYIILLITALFNISAFSQVTNLTPEYKIIDIGAYHADHARHIILLHEMYNGTTINNNYAIGTITAMRGSSASFHRLNIVNINTGSAYDATSASLQSFDNNASWKFKTCIYNNKKYLAVEVPYSGAYHDEGFKFCGWAQSTGESLKRVAYEVNGLPINQDLINNIQDYNTDMIEKHDVAGLNITGNVGIGTENPQGYKLAVAGNMIAESIKVKLQGAWPDYVFAENYKLATLQETEQHIKENGHLEGMPSAEEVKANGIDLGEMNAKLLKKIEELTLYLIEQDKEMNELKNEVYKLKGH